jgi:hypothetical protein
LAIHAAFGLAILFGALATTRERPPTRRGMYLFARDHPQHPISGREDAAAHAVTPPDPRRRVHTMYARIVRAQVPPEHFDQVLAATKERNVPMVTQFPGFKAGYWAADRHAGIVATVVLLDSEEGIRAAEAGMEQMRPLMEQFGVRLDSVENLQVLLTEATDEAT